MPKKIDPLFIDHAISLINGGKTLTAAALDVGINRNAVSKKIRARGISIPDNRGTPKNAKQLPDDCIIADYESGISELELSKKYGVSRNAIRYRLLKSGIQIRNQSQANIVSMGRMTIEQRKNRAKSANNALRGAKQPIEGKVKRAINIESAPYENMIGIGEEEFYELLTEHGISFTWQKAIEIYSLDFAIGNVAVELRSGGASNGRDGVTRGRIKYLRERGIISLYVSFQTVADLIGNFDYIISNVNKLNRNPSPIGKYWVIRSRFDKFSRIRNDLGQFACVPTPPKLFASCREINY